MGLFWGFGLMSYISLVGFMEDNKMSETQSVSEHAQEPSVLDRLDWGMKNG